MPHYDANTIHKESQPRERFELGTTLSLPNRSINLPIAREEVAGLVPTIESAMMYSNNVVVFMDLCIMGVMFVISLSPNLFLDPPSPQLLPLSCTVGMSLLLTVAAVSLPSPSQAINHNKCSRIVCIDILT